MWVQSLICRRCHPYSVSFVSSHVLRLRMAPAAVLISNILHLHFGIQIWCLKIILQTDLKILPNSNRPKEDWQEQTLKRYPQNHNIQ